MKMKIKTLRAFRLRRILKVREVVQWERLCRRNVEETQKQKKRAAQIRKVKAFPKKVMTSKEFACLPMGRDINLENCPLGTWFVCTPLEGFSGVVLGQVVKGLDLFANQWGHLCPPSRGINRYLLEIVE